MTGVTVHVDVHEVTELAHDILRNAGNTGDKVSRVIVKGGHDMQAMAILDAPVDTGHLKSSISIDFQAGRGAGGRFQSNLGFDLGPTAEYGGYVELGVDHPWTIRAKPGGALHFMIGGEDVFAKSVVHPPMPPQPYLGPAFDHGMPLIVHGIASVGESVLSRA